MKVPTTLVGMKAPGPSIERFTWDSAARCMTQSGAKSAKRWRRKAAWVAARES
jgi:hypothetical protein